MLSSVGSRAGTSCACLSGVSARGWARRVSAWQATVPADVEVTCGDRSQLLSVGRLARFADGSATARDGDTSVLVTVVSRARSGPSPGFLPLTVDYKQKAAAAGRIPTNFLRRELGISEAEILTGRMIDRSLRPLFPAGFTADTQISCNLLAVDGEHLPDVLCVNAASAALACSPVPWLGPVAAVRVGLLDSAPVINPTRQQLVDSSLNLLVTAGPNRTVVMLEASSSGVLLPNFMHAIKVGVTEVQSVISGIEKLRTSVGVEKRAFEAVVIPDDIVQSVRALSDTKLADIFSDGSHDKVSRDEAVQALRVQVMNMLQPDLGADKFALVSDAFWQEVRRVFRDLVMTQNLRCDGRSLSQLRPISCEVGLHRPLHGSALFQRGQTQVMATVAFDSPESVLKSDMVTAIVQGVKPKNFMLHYEFPPYSTNETGRGGPPGRREVGHGALAERALRAVVPEQFPFTIRLSADVLESNGSSSMAAVCAGSLALMDAGVPLTAPAAGVAIGMISQSSDDGTLEDYRILTDLSGIEDYCGDMDFKLACTPHAITALQADFKLPGVPLKVVMEAVKAGRVGCNSVLGIMRSTLDVPRADKSNWPVLEELSVPAYKRSRLVGPGGIHLRRLAMDTGVQVTPRDDSVYMVFAPNPEAMAEARQRLDALLADQDEPRFEFGAVYSAVIVELRDQGVMVKLHPASSPALVHNTQLDQRVVRHPSALGLSVGEQIQVKYFGRDPVSGSMRLSRKAIIRPASDAVKNLIPKDTASL